MKLSAIPKASIMAAWRGTPVPIPLAPSAAIDSLEVTSIQPVAVETMLRLPYELAFQTSAREPVGASGQAVCVYGREGVVCVCVCRVGHD